MQRAQGKKACLNVTVAFSRNRRLTQRAVDLQPPPVLKPFSWLEVGSGKVA